MKDLELRTISGLVDEASSLRVGPSKLEIEMNRLTAENKVVHAIGKEISGLKTTANSIVGSLQDVKIRAIETERGLKNAQKTIAASGSWEKTLAEKFSSLMKELSSVRVKSVNLRSDLDEMIMIARRAKEV